MLQNAQVIVVMQTLEMMYLKFILMTNFLPVHMKNEFEKKKKTLTHTKNLMIFFKAVERVSSLVIIMKYS